MIKPLIVKHQKEEGLNLPNSHLLINLLPPEVILGRKQHFKFAFISKISIIVLVALVFLTSTTLALRFSQTFELKKAEQGLVLAEGKVSSQKDKEGQKVTLKKRLDSIEAILGGDSKRKAIFNMIIFLIPPDIQVLEVDVNKNGNMNLSLSSFSLSAIQTLFDDLGNKEKNSDLISKVDIEGISLGRDSIYRFSLNVTPK